MKRLACGGLLLTALVQTAAAHDLGIGDVLISPYGNNDSIETDDLLITKEYAEADFYRITIRSKSSRFVNSTRFQMDGGREPHFRAFHERDYCARAIIFITLHASGPRYAEGITGMFYTYAFLADTFEFLADFPSPFEEIAPLEDGADIGMPYFMPQRYLVVCKTAAATTPFRFSFTDRAPDFRGFDDAAQGLE
jgi:hypothetical protein